jgi:uncharacterized protein (DUF427 family)
MFDNIILIYGFPGFILPILSFYEKIDSIMPPKPKLNVQNFPRPPLLEKTNRHVQIKWHSQTIADTKDAYWVLETYHAPSASLFSESTQNSKLTLFTAYYLPVSSISLPLTPTKKSTFCEWKGWATYYNITLPKTADTQREEIVEERIWSYESPTKGFMDLKGFVSFYVGPWTCFVDGEEVKPQPGDFYGGWTTSELEGIIKGDAATRWM